MKKKVAALLTMIVTVGFLAGCGNKSMNEVAEQKEVTSPNPTVNDILEEKTSGEVATESSTESVSIEVPLPDEDIDESVSYSSIEGVDIDLSSLSSTVVYAQVYNMMFYPENFVGKTIRMEGLYSDYFDQAKGKHYFACIIMDATACCSQGVEFELSEDYTYPDDYPSEGDDVIVEGVFDLYQEDGYNYCTLRDAKLIQS